MAGVLGTIGVARSRIGKRGNPDSREPDCLAGHGRYWQLAAGPTASG